MDHHPPPVGGDGSGAEQSRPQAEVTSPPDRRSRPPRRSSSRPAPAIAAARSPEGVAAVTYPSPPEAGNPLPIPVSSDPSARASRLLALEPPRERSAPAGHAHGAPEPVVHRYPIPTDRIDPDAARVVRRLVRHGFDAYLVGGGVRDLLLDRRPKDFDIATSARPHQVRALFRNCRVIGRRFRLAHILFAAGKVIEVATFRRDPGAEALAEESREIAPEEARLQRRGEAVDLLIRNDNVFGEPHEDAVRRDFTINGLFYDIGRGEVLDYVGGMDDLERRVVRTIGDPDVRFREDPVRILRAIKFAARLDFGIEPELYDAMVAHRGELEKAARPRLLEEVLRLLRGGASHRSFWICWETGMLGVFLPELSVFLDDDPPEASLVWKRLQALDRRIADGDAPADAVMLCALVLGPIEEALEGARDVAEAFDDDASATLERLAVPRRMRDRMKQIVAALPRLRRGRGGALARRDFYDDAMALWSLDAEARGQTAEPPRVALAPVDDASPQGPSDEPPRFGRRGRRRRPQGT
ncbi:MAG: poly(A) polymerase [Deltaproteobacteria bacterium]|nr:poly(A) polymerase [Deltaproteobacteria bacterium]